jgi:hypothetical protein
VEVWTEILHVHEGTHHEVASENISVFYGPPAFWDRLGSRMCVNIDLAYGQVTTEGMSHWDASVLNLYIVWKLFQFRLECCQFLRTLLIDKKSPWKFDWVVCTLSEFLFALLRICSRVACIARPCADL